MTKQSRAQMRALSLIESVRGDLQAYMAELDTKVQSDEVQLLRELVRQLRLLIESAGQLPPSRKRDSAISDLARYRDRLDTIAARLLH
jgi:hypothetical protein